MHRTRKNILQNHQRRNPYPLFKPARAAAAAAQRKKEEEGNQQQQDENQTYNNPEKKNTHAGYIKLAPKKHTLDVTLVKDKTPQLKCEVTDGLPKPPFLLTVVAPRRSGKTNLLLDALLDPDKFCNKFDAIFIWSRTFHLDAKWRNISLPPGSVFEAFNEEECLELLEVAEKINAKVRPPVNILFIFDDMITEGIMNARRMGTLDRIAVRGRHCKVSIIILTQQYLALSPPVRNNTTNMIMFRVRNGDEMEKIARENREWLSIDEFKSMAHEVTSERYSFLHINNQEDEPKNRFHYGWKGVWKPSGPLDSEKKEGEKIEQQNSQSRR
jgi:hypothetical protein